MFAVVCADFDGDGHDDAVLAQNFYSPEPETGRMDGGIGWMLRNDGVGQLTAVPALHSGLVVPEDAKALVWNGELLVFGTNDGPLRVYRRAR